MFEMERLEPGTATDLLPDGLADMAPGAGLAVVLEGLDRRRLTGHDRVVVMQARARLVAHFQSELFSDMIGVADSVAEELGAGFDLSEIEDSAATEIRAALSLTRRSAEYQLETARLVYQRVPQVWAAMNAGWIDLAKARVIVDQTLHVEPPVARFVADEVLGSARFLTTGQLRARISRLVIIVDPDAAKKRYEDGLADRRVTCAANPDGTANLFGLSLPAAQTHAAMRRINRLARAARCGEDPRSMDQIRADVLIDILQGRSRDQGRDRAVIDIQIDLRTLAELSDDPGAIPGWGPVLADVARQVVDDQPTAQHRVTVTGAEGETVWTGVTRRRPTPGQRRRIEARNPSCVFPGCRMPAVDCDIDHHQEWAKGGCTEPRNIGPLCRHDHVVRHRGWSLAQFRPGVYRWTSPLGHVYIAGPDPP
jgi:hypothetical protein